TSNLDNQLQLPLAAHTVLKDDKGKTLAGSLSTLDYLFRFLDAYDFTSEGAEEIQEENKNLINASVLGLIFEKINGYKDGSFFTPGFVTMYMCRETIRRAVVQKFNEAMRQKNDEATDAPYRYTTLDEVYNAIPRDIDRDAANKLINSLTICDPAVGSGHFLVSALNEIIAIKSELRILQDAEGKLLRDVDVVVENDELIVTDGGELFQYNPQGKESRRVQETLFHEKQRLIEGCLFGVDINPNSVKICRLRLWIELLKNAYYTADSGYTELETLPNIDINIKTGNSLVSRFALDADLAPALKSLKWDINAYRGFVQDYKEAKGKEEKRGLEALIEGIKKDFRTEIGRNDPKLKKLSKLNGEYEALMNQREIFELSKAESKQRKTQREKLEKDIDKLSTEVQDIKNNKIYEQAFEWRFEFPEVLDNEARFMGFDVVIGNPPYIRQEELGDAKKYLKEAYKNVFAGTADLLVYFFELGIGLLKNSGHFTMITSNKFMRANYGKSLRHYLRSHNLERIIDFGELPVFENAATFPAIFSLTKKPPTNAVSFAQVKSLDFESLETLLTTIAEPLPESAVSGDNWTLANESGSFLIEKMKVGTVSLGEYVGNKINYGVKTGFNPAFVIDAKKRDELINQDANAAEIIFPFRVGDDVRKYEIREADRFIIFTQRGIDIEKYPSVRNHLSAFREKLEPDGVSGRKQGPYAWYEIQDTVAYYESFNLPKIIYPVIGKESRFAFDRDTLFLNDKTFFIPIEDYFLLGYLNSKLAWYYLKAICSVLGDADKGGRLELRAVHVKTLPIPNASEASKTKIANIVTQVLNAKQNGEDTTVLEAEIDELVYELYQLSAEERGIVGGKQA
ncbi:MAG: Eco57I restriction-modification methylase domain-containing protein, partial [Chitinophagaceae bacterium]